MKLPLHYQSNSIKQGALSPLTDTDHQSQHPVQNIPLILNNATNKHESTNFSYIVNTPPWLIGLCHLHQQSVILVIPEQEEF